MKLTKQAITGVLLLWLAAHANAASTVSYSASAAPNANPDANGGTVNVWNTSTIGANAGFFQGNSGSNGDGNGAGAGTSAWAMYANSGSEAFANHTFAVEPFRSPDSRIEFRQRLYRLTEVGRHPDPQRHHASFFAVFPGWPKLL